MKFRSCSRGGTAGGTSGDLRTAQRALRHASPASTAIYTQVADDALYRAIAGIPA